MGQSAKDLQGIVEAVERELAGFYGFAVQASAVHHLVTKEQLVESLGDAATAQPEFAARGGVWLKQESDDDVFIGLHLDDEITRQLRDLDPTVSLADQNLDAFCVLAEELSHFHLLLDRLDQGRGVSKLELEWQGEVDKLLLAALLLQRQAGDPHLPALARRLFDTAVITAEDHELYAQATRYAAKFWYGVVQSTTEDGATRELGPGVRAFLKHNYRASWNEKLANLSSLNLKRAG